MENMVLCPCSNSRDCFFYPIALFLVFPNGYRYVFWLARNVWAPFVLGGMGFWVKKTNTFPELVNPDLETYQSCKMNAFRELLYNCLEGGHRMLVFSQFVQVLKLLKAELQSADLPFCYLDGSTTDRMAQVDRFQEDESIPVFLISLKAGGTGLNLTAADVVVHFDPWWNPAAEAQATDRAHRIGQDKQVNVYKFITTGTVEEKVLDLQKEKRKLLEQVFDESEAANLKLSVQDLRELI